MTNTEIDDAVLAVLSTKWQEVTMVIGAVGQSIATPERDDEFDRVAKRIYALAPAGRIATAGDIKRWRESEVRLA